MKQDKITIDIDVNAEPAISVINNLDSMINSTSSTISDMEKSINALAQAMSLIANKMGLSMSEAGKALATMSHNLNQKYWGNGLAEELLSEIEDNLKEEEYDYDKPIKIELTNTDELYIPDYIIQKGGWLDGFDE